MSEVLVRFDEPIAGPDGRKYFALAVGKETAGELCEGWLEFLLVDDDSSEPLCSERETSQPNRRSLDYWAQGLTRVYLEGALARAAAPPPAAARLAQTSGPRRSAPRRKPRNAGAEGFGRPILDPYAVYAQGEHILRSELGALSRDQLEIIANAYGFAATREAGESSKPGLVDSVVNGVRSAESR